jgi:hypothetical protein
MQTQRMVSTLMFAVLLLALFIGAYLAGPGNAPWLPDPMIAP